MDKSIKAWADSLFESIKHTNEDGVEYWLGRELATALDYSWEGFEPVIARAKVSVVKTGMKVEDHFRQVSTMVTVGSGADRIVENIELTRYACYIIAQNGSPGKKPKIAAAQAYFAIQTRQQELSVQREYDMERLIARQKFTESDKHMSEAIMEKGMSGRGLATIKDSGIRKLYGGKTTKQMKKQYGITKAGIPLANRAPNVVLAGMSFANEMTAVNLERLPIDTFREIKAENDGNNEAARNAMIERGIVPEEVPPGEDTAQVMKRFKKDEKRKTLESPES